MNSERKKYEAQVRLACSRLALAVNRFCLACDVLTERLFFSYRKAMEDLRDVDLSALQEGKEGSAETRGGLRGVASLGEEETPVLRIVAVGEGSEQEPEEGGDGHDS